MRPASFLSSPPAGVKKGQMLSFDFLFASSFFLLVCALLVFQAGYKIKETQEVREKTLMLNDLEKLSDIFFSEGIPYNWTIGDVQAIGLQEGGRVSFMKLSNFSQISYEESLLKLGMNNDYNITMTASGTDIYSFGASYENSTSLMKRDRICVLENGTLATIRILVFEK